MLRTGSRLTSTRASTGWDNRAAYADAKAKTDDVIEFKDGRVSERILSPKL